MCVIICYGGRYVMCSCLRKAYRSEGPSGEALPFGADIAVAVGRRFFRAKRIKNRCGVQNGRPGRCDLKCGPAHRRNSV